VTSTLVVAAAALALSMLVIKGRLMFGGRGLDLPGHRSLHDRPTPHGGGLGIIAAALVAGGWLGVAPVWLAGVLILATISLVDDWRHLPSWLRLFFHLGVAAAVVFLHEPGFVPGGLAAVVLIAWAINAYNFMDGADGLAGSMTASGFGAYSVAFANAGFPELAGWSLAVAGAACGFLVFNWHPARIFMGDVGSIPLGFLAGGLGWYGVSVGAWAAWFPALVFAPFLLDASVTLMRRAVAGRRIWEAHREHYYQRMVRMGSGHAAVCRIWLFWMVASAALALGLLQSGLDGHESAGWVGAFIWMCTLAVFGRWVDGRWRASEVRKE